MTDRPILFSGAMVRAILAGTKTQTRRLIRANRPHRWPTIVHRMATALVGKHWAEPGGWVRPFALVGDRLWVRETWGLHRPVDFTEWRPGSMSGVTELPDDWTLAFRGDRGSNEEDCIWRPSIHMPRWASRLTLEVVSVRMERLQEISEEDARAEGAEPDRMCPPGYLDKRNLDSSHTYRGAFACLWDSINGERTAWESNPWVWRVEFKVAGPSAESMVDR